MVGVAGVKDRKAPHGSKRDERAVDRMRMEIWHRGGLRSFDQQNGPVSAAGESCDLGEQPSIDQRYREVGDRLAFDQHLVGNQIVARDETQHPHVERAASLDGIKQRRLPLCVIHVKPNNRTGHGATAPG